MVLARVIISIVVLTVLCAMVYFGIRGWTNPIKTKAETMMYLVLFFLAGVMALVAMLVIGVFGGR